MFLQESFLYGKTCLVPRIHGLGMQKSILGLGSTRASADVRKARLFVQCVFFITRDFNPVHPCILATKLTVLSVLLNALIYPKEVEGSSCSCGGTESTYSTVVVDAGVLRSVGCVA